MPVNLIGASAPHIIKAQAVPLPDFSGLPDWAQAVIYTVIAFAVGISIMAPAFGFFKSKNAAPVAINNPVSAAVIVDPAALNAASTQISIMNDKLEKLTDGLEELCKQMEIDRAVRSRH